MAEVKPANLSANSAASTEAFSQLTAAYPSRLNQAGAAFSRRCCFPAEWSHIWLGFGGCSTQKPQVIHYRQGSEEASTPKNMIPCSDSYGKRSTVRGICCLAAVESAVHVKAKAITAFFVYA